ncbi:uncharacterized protein BDZ99DRAFT_424309 [Mytilinidion resinicola]|uniref:Rab-GAP TBC domain-containing protein n=1 Tax=Mytilinidion resinicola TaxID=574789 RepID=A0A6A6YAR1_9PEZI|nr:uncharacterized protein BDZ99DRAFT_424309 [Mytilinidion resinicola]KAF2805094.1 hypothetical protein BDZ99DRAFT_424309 [Mytilinidion resinicola]
MSASQSSLSDLDHKGRGPGEEKPSAAPTIEVPSLPLPDSRPLSPAAAEKIAQIADACTNEDLRALIDLATTKDGLVEDSLRRTAWPLLLGSNNSSLDDQVPWTSLPPHRDEDQVKLDVNRSFVYYPNNESDKQLDKRKRELSNVITEVLRRHPILCYFQGYHDIVQVILLVLGAKHSPAAVTRLSLLRIRDFMLPSLDAAISHLHLLHPILDTVDPALREHLSHTQPFFALAATLTLYAHDIQEYGDIARLFDFFLAREAVIPVYFFAVVVLARKDELLEIPPDEPEMLHSILCKLPKPLDLELLISNTTSLFDRHPPKSLSYRAWSRVSSYSVLKTTQIPSSVAKQTLEEGNTLFSKQEVEMRRAKAIQKAVNNVKRQAWLYRRPAGAFGLAVAVGLVAWWLGKSPITGAGRLSESLRKIMAFFV